MNGCSGCIGHGVDLLAALEQLLRDRIEPGQLQRPFQADPDQRRAERRPGDENRARSATATPPGAPRRPTRRSRRSTTAATPREPRDDGGAHRREPQAAAEPLRGGVAADQRADPGAVDHRHAAEVDDEVALARPEELLDVALERLGRAARDERHLGRQDEAVGGGRLVSGTVKEDRANYTPSARRGDRRIIPGMPTDVRDALRGFAKQPEFRGRGGPVAGPGGRRQHGHLQRRQRAAAPPAALSAGRPPRDPLEPLARPRHHARTGSRPRSTSTSGTARRASSRSAIVYGANENLTGDGEPERIATVRVSSNLLPMLGAQPAAGRLFTAEEDTQTPAEHGDPRLRDVGPPLRQRSERRRPPHRAERTAVSDRRRAARVVLAAARGRADARQRRRRRPRDPAAAWPGRRAGAQPRGLQHRRPAEAGRDGRAGRSRRWTR